jgi:uncharacterized protein YcfJ
MYLTSALRRGLVIAGISVLALVGLMGWMSHSPAPPVAAGSPAYAVPPGNPEPTAAAPPAYAPANAYGETTSPVYATSPFGDSGYTYNPPAPAPVVSAPPLAERVVVERQYVYRGGRRYVVVHRRHRRWVHEAEVIGGTAAAGALIGGIAGGGKGAGIGALAGGAGGYLYEKLHK